MNRMWLMIAAAACGRDHFDPAHNYMFVTSTIHVPTTFGADLSGADAICAARAAEADLLGTFVAYLGIPGVPAVDRLGNARGWIRIDGEPFADMPAGRKYHPPNIDELGEDLGAVPVATGQSGTDCRAWTDPTNQYDYGAADQPAAGWAVVVASSYQLPCTTSAHLYCFGIAYDAALEVTPAAGRKMFVTVQGFQAGGGLAAADALCAQEASLAGIPGQFLAFLPTSTASAASRFDLTGPPWVRIDGIRLAAKPFDLIAGALETSPSVTSANTEYVGAVITGGVLPGDTSTTTCSDWTDPNAFPGAGGSFEASAAAFTSGNNAICSGGLPIYCFER